MYSAALRAFSAHCSPASSAIASSGLKLLLNRLAVESLGLALTIALALSSTQRDHLRRNSRNSSSSTTGSSLVSPGNAGNILIINDRLNKSRGSVVLDSSIALITFGQYGS